MHLTHNIGTLALAAVLAPAAAALQEADEAVPAIHEEDLLEDLSALLEGLETRAPFYNRTVRADQARNIFADLSLQFVQLTDRAGNSVPGLEFAYDRTFGDRELPEAGEDWSSFLRLTSTGTVAFDGTTRPRDFMESALTWRASYDVGGVSKPSAARAACDFLAASPGAGLADGMPALFALRTELALEAAEAETPEELLKCDAYRELMRQATDLLEDQVHFDIGLDLGLENTQDFAQRQLRFGLASAFEYKSWESGSVMPYFNVFDYPASLVRWMTGYDEEWGPGGHLFPILMFDVSQVMVEKNRVRNAAGDDDDFVRAHFEASYRAPLGEIGSELYYLDAVYHHYADLDPSASIEAARLDDFDYLTVELNTEDGVFFAVDVGQLPFEARDTTVVSLGYRFTGRNFNRR